MNHLRLKREIMSKFDSESQFAKHIGWSRQRVNLLTSGKKTFNVNEVKIFCDGLGLTKDQAISIFLTNQS